MFEDGGDHEKGAPTKEFDVWMFQGISMIEVFQAFNMRNNEDEGS